MPEPALRSFQYLAEGDLDGAVDAANAAGAYVPEVLRLAAASDGASREIIVAANSLESVEGIDANTLWIAVGAAIRHDQPAEEYIGQAAIILDQDAELAHDFYSALVRKPFVQAQADAVLEGVGPDLRGRAYAMGVAALGADAPQAWREGARRLLFIGERPYLR